MTCARTSRRQHRGGQAEWHVRCCTRSLGQGPGQSTSAIGATSTAARTAFTPASACFPETSSVQGFANGREFLFERKPAILLRDARFECFAEIAEAAGPDRAGRALEEMQALAPGGLIRPPGAEGGKRIGSFFAEGGDDQRQFLGAEIRFHACQPLEIEHGSSLPFLPPSADQHGRLEMPPV